MSYLIGIIAGAASLLFALQMLGQNSAQYVDFVALAIVVGGTTAVGIITMPWEHARTLARSFLKLIVPRLGSYRRLMLDCLQIVYGHATGASVVLRAPGLAGEILRDGHELLGLNFSIEDLEAILHERVDQAGERARLVSNALRALSKYPPAFGLIGTVFGLVGLMRAITDGLEPRQTGLRMAIALVATLYGLLLANFIIAPLGEAVVKHANAERHRADLAVAAVLLAARKASLLTAQEVLNSYLPPSRRMNFVARVMSEDERDAA